MSLNTNKTYALVEFVNDKKKEWAIVPLIWLIDDRKRCYWPKTRSKQAFDKLVLDNIPFDNTWIKYKVNRVLKVSGDYSGIIKYMNIILEHGSTEDNELDFIEVEISHKKVESDNEDNEDNKEENTSDSSDSDEKSPQSKRVIIKSEGSSSKNTQNIDELNRHASLRQKTDAGTIMFQQQFQDVIQRLEKLTILLEQNNACTNQISQDIESSSNPTSKPDGLPDLPLKSYDDFKKLEEFLSEQTVNSEGREVPAPAYIYLKRLLSTIDGANLRSSVMNMLKFIITNELAMTYSWKGKTKRSFENTKLCKVITDAVKMQFTENNYCHQCIKNAIQSWLNSAKSRHVYNANAKKN